MFKAWFNAFKSKKKQSTVFPGKNINPKLLCLEDRITPAQVVDISYDSINGFLILQSKALASEANTFSISQVDPSNTTIQFTGSVGTTFNSTVPNTIFLNPSTAELDAINLVNFNSIIVRGSLGDDRITLGTLDGNVLSASNQNDFNFNMDVVSFSGGGSSGGDLLNISGKVSTKGNGFFTTDFTKTINPNQNFDSIQVGSSGGVFSTGSGEARLVADGLNTSNILINSGGMVTIGSGEAYFRSGAAGNIRTNGNAITTIGGPITLASNLLLESSTVLDTGIGLGSISLNGTVSGSVSGMENLDLVTTGPVNFNQQVGSLAVPLGSINLGNALINSNPSVVQFGTDVIAKSISGTIDGPFTSKGVLSLNGSSNLNSLDITTTGPNGNVTIGSSGASNPVLISNGQGGVNIKNSSILTINGDVNLDGSFSQIGSGLVNLGTPGIIGQIDFNTNDGKIAFSSGVTLYQDISFNSNLLGVVGLGKDIVFSSTLDGVANLQTAAGIGDTFFGGNIGSSVAPLAILVNSTNRLTVNGSVTADSFTVSSASNAVEFKGSQTYGQLAGLNVTTSTSNGSVTLSGPVNCINDALININNSGILIISNGSYLKTNTSGIVLGNGGASKIIVSADIISESGNILIKNPVEMQSDISIVNNGGNVQFLQTLDSNKSGNKSISLIGNNASVFSFNGALGSIVSLNAINIFSSAGVTFNSTVNATTLTIFDSVNNITLNGNLTLAGDFITTLTTNNYNAFLYGLKNQINGITNLAHSGSTTFGKINTASFLFSNGLTETGGSGVTAQGTIISGKSFNLASNFIVGGNNIGIVTLDIAQDSVLSGREDVQANEKIIKNGIGGLRLLNNTGSSFKGSLDINNGLVTVLDNFSSISTTSVYGGSVSGIGSIGSLVGYSGIVSPGDPTGVLSSGSTALNSLATFSAILGTNASIANNSLDVIGSVTLNAATLSLTTGPNLIQGNIITIINNDGSDPITGSFKGLPEGTTFTSGVYTFKISYAGGTGNDVTLTVTSTVIPPTPVVPGIPQVFATAANAGGGPMVTLNYPNGNTVSFFAYSPSFTGGVRIAMGDVNGDGYTDLVTGVGIGGGPHIKVWDISSGAPIQVASFFAFESAFTGGLYLGVGNLNGDAYGDIIVGAGPGGGPRVTAFAGAQAFAINQNQVLTNFFAYSDVFRGGVTVAAADRTGDGVDEIVTGAGYGGGPNVSVFQLVQTTPNQFNPQLIQNFFVFDTTFTGGIFVAGGRFSNGTNSSGQILDDIFVGTGTGTKATVAVAFGTGGFYYLNPFGNFQGGVTVGISSSSATSGGTNYLMAAAGPGGGPQVNIYNNSFGLVDSFFALNPEMTLGVFANTTIL